MAEDETGREKRHFRTAEPADGPDTVRILPDDSQATHAQEWHVEKHPVQRGTLYSPAPTAAPAQPDQQPVSAAPKSDGWLQDPRAVVPGVDASPEPYAGQTRLPARRDERTALDEPGVQPASSVTHIHKGPSACAIIAATVGLLMVACALLAFATVRSGMDGFGRLAGIIPSFGLVTTPTVTIDTTRPTVIDQVRALSKLETIHYQLEKVVTGKSTGPLPDFLTSDKILLVAHGEVVAGVDLSKLTAADITVMSDTVTIRMPRAEVLYSKLDNSKTYVYDRQTGVFSSPDPNLETQIRQAAEQEILNTALEDGILDKASKNAEEVLRTLLSGLGYEEVRFTQSP
ncbi:MAG: DUF4230 domain-containing protein [Chloroflexota bacterium]